MSTAHEPVRIAFCITDLDAGGAERALVQIVTRLDRSLWEPRVFCLSGPGELVGLLQKADIPVECLGAQRWWNFGAVWGLARRLAIWKPALVQTFLFHANIAGRLAAKAAGVRPVICGIRVAERRSRLHLWLDRATDWMVDHHVCVSDGVARFSIETGKLPADKVSVIPNGVDAEFFANARPADLAEFEIPNVSEVVLFVGRLDEQKAPEVALRAFELLAPDRAAAHLLFVGDGPLRAKLETQVASARLSDRVHFAGRRADVANLMRASTCLLLTSCWEGMPNVVLEAMAAGLVVVSTQVEGITELIDNGRTGLLASSHSPTEIAGRLTELLGSPSMRTRLAESAQHLVQNGFMWSKVVVAYEQLYRRLVSQ